MKTYNNPFFNPIKDFNRSELQELNVEIQDDIVTRVNNYLEDTNIDYRITLAAPYYYPELKAAIYEAEEVADREISANAKKIDDIAKKMTEKNNVMAKYNKYLNEIEDGIQYYQNELSDADDEQYTQQVQEEINYLIQDYRHYETLIDELHVETDNLHREKEELTEYNMIYEEIIKDCKSF